MASQEVAMVINGAVSFTQGSSAGPAVLEKAGRAANANNRGAQNRRNMFVPPNVALNRARLRASAVVVSYVSVIQPTFFAHSSRLRLASARSRGGLPPSDSIS